MWGFSRVVGQSGWSEWVFVQGGIFLLYVFANEGRMGEINQRENPEKWVCEEHVQKGGAIGSVLRECVFWMHC